MAKRPPLPIHSKKMLHSCNARHSMIASKSIAESIEYIYQNYNRQGACANQSKEHRTNRKRAEFQYLWYRRRETEQKNR